MNISGRLSLYACFALLATPTLFGQATGRVAVTPTLETLRGVRQMSIDVQLPTGRTYTVAGIREQLAAALRSHGVSLLADGLHPRLTLRGAFRDGRFTASTATQRETTPFTAFGLALEFSQLLPLPGRGGSADATTWRTVGVGYMDLPDVVAEMTNDFLSDYVSMNQPISTPASLGIKPSVTRMGNNNQAVTYGEVPENFLPSFPIDLGPDGYIQMTKKLPGSLVSMHQVDALALTLDFLVQRRLGTTHYNTVASFRKDSISIEEYTAVRGAPVIKCQYNNAVFFYWLKNYPPNASPAQLKALRPNSIFLDMGAPVDNCPLTSAIARTRK